MGVWGYSVYYLRFWLWWNLRRCYESGFWAELRWLGKKDLNRDLGRVLEFLYIHKMRMIAVV